MALPYISELKRYLTEGFYFSHGYDLTASRQRRVQYLQGLDSAEARGCKGGEPMRAITCDYRYFWNINLCKDFLDSKVDVRWCTPLI